MLSRLYFAYATALFAKLPLPNNTSTFVYKIKLSTYNIHIIILDTLKLIRNQNHPCHKLTGYHKTMFMHILIYYTIGMAV